MAGSTTKSWSFSQSKYGAQQANECSNYPSGTTWCAQDAGNGVWSNGSNVVGNDPLDTSIRTTPEDAAGFVRAVLSEYSDSVEHTPDLWSANV